MKRINKYLENNMNKIITIFIILQPILDLLVSLAINVFDVSFNIGMVVRIVFLFILFYIVCIVKRKYNIFVYLALLLIYSILFLVSLDNNYVFSNIHGFMRSFYFPILLILLYNVKDDIKIDNKYFLISLFTYIILIFIADITKTGFKSYDIAKKGSLGWFNSTNEISCIISILIPLLFIWLKDRKNIILKVILLGVFLFVIGNLGTKTPILSLFITMIIVLIYVISVVIKKKNGKLLGVIICLTLVAFLGTVLIIPKTNFYKNIKIHMNFLKIDSVDDVFRDDYYFDHFIFSQRITFMRNTDMKFWNKGLKNVLFGIGYVNEKGLDNKAIEMDYYDIFYNHGIGGFVLYFSVYVYILYLIFRKLPRKVNFDLLMRYLSLILILVLALYSGHVLLAPAVSIYVSLIVIAILQEEISLNSFHNKDNI